jgi:hypothetical protein
VSLELHDAKGYVADLGSAVGYSSFIDWATTLRKPVLTKFGNRGETTDLDGLIEALASLRAPDRWDEQLRREVLAAARKARRRHGQILVCTNGEEEG